jgi:hypothetical protein
MTSGHKGHFVGGLGLGLAAHELTVPAAMGTGTTGKSGLGSYLTLSGGYELGLGHLLLGGALSLTGSSADKVGIASTGSAGLEVRIGYAQW